MGSPFDKHGTLCSIFYLLMFFSFTSALQKECLNNALLQPFNAHIPFTLQFFIEFSLHGMDLIHFNRVDYRRLPQNMETPKTR